MRYLGIDPAKKTGWAVVSATGKLIASGAYKFVSSEGELAVATLDVYRSVIDGDDIKVAVESQYVETNVATSIVCARRAGIIEGVLHAAGCHPSVWHPKPSEWRAVLGIKGTKRDAVKASAMAYCTAIGANAASEDEAEAICIAMAWWAKDTKQTMPKKSRSRGSGLKSIANRGSLQQRTKRA